MRKTKRGMARLNQKNDTQRFAALAACLALALVSTGCSDEAEHSEESSGAGGAAGEVEMFSWWIGPGEAEALEALLQVHAERNPTATIFNAAAESGDAAKALLAERMNEGDPPDIFQDVIAELAILLDEDPDLLVPLDELFEDEGWNQTFLPQVLDAIRVDGKIVAMPVGVHRENALFYNREILTRYDLEPPTSLQQMFDMCDLIQAGGESCISTGYQDWIIRILFHSVAMATMGGQTYADFFTGKGDPEEPLLGEALDHLRTILDDYVSEQMKDPSVGWQQASDALIAGRAAFFFHGDWVGGYVQQLGWEAGVDYGVVGPPGASDVFLYNVDVFALPKGAKNPAGALAFFETIGSLEGQAAFNNIKGSTPVRLDADQSALTPVAQSALDDLAHADVVITTPAWDGVDAAVFAYAEGGSKAKLIEYFQDAIYNQ